MFASSGHRLLVGCERSRPRAVGDGAWRSITGVGIVCYQRGATLGGPSKQPTACLAQRATGVNQTAGTIVAWRVGSTVQRT